MVAVAVAVLCLAVDVTEVSMSALLLIGLRGRNDNMSQTTLFIHCFLGYTTFTLLLASRFLYITSRTTWK